ncbi:MAG: hypothetical protein H6Q76_2326 [Firmicutes bacterium]|nr:hypothetical protein [Bacillota bacterium]
MLQQPHPYGSGFWRFVAFLIDSLLLGAIGAGIDLFLGIPAGVSMEAIAQQTGLPSLLKLVFHLSYWPLFESSAWQATPGKRICRLYVADLAGSRISFVRAFVRNTAKVLSLIPLGFGFLMIGITLRNQCLHDKIAGTVVLRKQQVL